MDAPIKSEHDVVGDRRPTTCSAGLIPKTGIRMDANPGGALRGGTPLGG